VQIPGNAAAVVGDFKSVLVELDLRPVTSVWLALVIRRFAPENSVHAIVQKVKNGFVEPDVPGKHVNEK
jgi:hypothetical protein